MANKTISELAAVTSANDADLLIIEQGGTTYKITKVNLFSVISAALTAEIASTNSDITTLQGNRLKNDGTVTATAALNMGTNKINNVVDPASAQDAATKNYVDTITLSAITAPDASVDLNSQRIINLLAPSSNNDAARKTDVDTVNNNALRFHSSSPLDCSSNPNYPVSSKGEILSVSVAGKIGGDSGEVVEVGDLIVCITTSAGGTEAAVGSEFIVLQANVVGDASATAKGVVELATDAEVVTGTSTTLAVTPANLENKLGTRYWQRTAVAETTKTLATTETGIVGITGTAGCTVTLPAIANFTTAAHARYIIVDEGGAAGTTNIIIDGNGAETINGVTTFTINKNYGSVEIYNNGGSSWFTTTYVDVESPNVGSGQLYSVSKTFTNEEVLGLGTGSEIVAAPGAGLVAVPVYAHAYMNTSGTGYATNTTLQLTQGNSDSYVQMNWHTSLLTSTSDVLKQAIHVQATGTTNDMRVNNPIHVKVNTGNPVTGDGVLTVYVQYLILNSAG